MIALSFLLRILTLPRAPIASLTLLLPYRYRALGAAFTLILAAGLVLALGQGVRRLIDRGFASNTLASLNHAATAMFLVVAALAFATAARFTLVS